MTQEQKTKIGEHFDELHATASGLASNVPDDLKKVLRAAYLAGAGYALEIYCPHWISVEDELPKESDYYLCVIGSTQEVLWYNEGIEEWYEVYATKEAYLDIEDLTARVTHWMPLPAISCSEFPNNHIIDANKKVENRVIGSAEHIQTALDVMKEGG